MAISPMKLEVKGFKELKRKLDALPGTLNRKIIKSALLRGATPIAKEARKNLKAILAKSTNKRREYGRPPGDLQRAMQGANARVFRKYAKGKSLVVIGPASFARHGHLLEYGTYKQIPRPFLRPAWDSQKAKAQQIIAEQIEKLLLKEWSK